MRNEELWNKGWGMKNCGIKDDGLKGVGFKKNRQKLPDLET